MTFKRVYLDTNVFIKTFEGKGGDILAENTVGIFGLTYGRKEPPFITSQITLAECLVRPFRDGDVQAQHRYRLLLSGSGHWLQVCTVSQSLLVLAARLRATSKLKLPDAIHFATAISAGCSHFMTGDSDFGAAIAAEMPNAPALLAHDEPALDELADWLRA